MYHEFYSDERIISFESIEGFIRMKLFVHSNEFLDSFGMHFQVLKHKFLTQTRSTLFDGNQIVLTI